MIFEPLGTSSAALSASLDNAPTILILAPPAAANTGGALPTPPTSSEPAPIACSIGGPEVKSANLILNGSLLISPEAVSSAWAPVPAWSPTRSVVPLNEALTTLTFAGPELADALELLEAFDPAEPEPEPEPETELEPQAARSQPRQVRRGRRRSAVVVVSIRQSSYVSCFRVHAQLGEQAIAE